MQKMTYYALEIEDRDAVADLIRQYSAFVNRTFKLPNPNDKYPQDAWFAPMPQKFPTYFTGNDKPLESTTFDRILFERHKFTVMFGRQVHSEEIAWMNAEVWLRFRRHQAAIEHAAFVLEQELDA